MARILVVDDCESIRLVLTQALQLDGHTITTAPNGAEAIAIFVDAPHDLVLTDMQMPYLSGPELIAAIQELSLSTPIIGMTAGLSPPLIEGERQRLNIPALFPKPLDLRDLRQAIQTLTRPGRSFAKPAE